MLERFGNQLLTKTIFWRSINIIRTLNVIKVLLNLTATCDRVIVSGFPFKNQSNITLEFSVVGWQCCCIDSHCRCVHSTCIGPCFNWRRSRRWCSSAWTVYTRLCSNYIGWVLFHLLIGIAFLHKMLVGRTTEPNHVQTAREAIREKFVVAKLAHRWSNTWYKAMYYMTHVVLIVAHLNDRTVVHRPVPSQYIRVLYEQYPPGSAAV